MRLRTGLVGLCAGLLLAAAVQAAAPQPAKPVDIDRFMGRWYEIARTPNPNQKDCWAATTDWVRKAGNRFSFVQTCRRGSPDGPKKVWQGAATIADPRTRAKLDLSFLGGVIKQEYWVLDHADDYSWAVVGTPGGNYVWLFSRQPSVSEAERAQLLQQVRALGYDTGKLQFAARSDAKPGA
jgi:apolipoprotein D and lipocalin family protein